MSIFTGIGSTGGGRGRAGQSAHCGFTMVEVIVAMAILGAVTLAVLKLYNTQHRATHVEQEVVEVQRDLRTAVIQLTRDIRMAGFMVTSNPISATGNNTGLNSSDTITFSAATTGFASARVAAEFTTVVTAGTPIAFTVTSPTEASFFSTGDIARVVDPSIMGQPAATAFTVTSVNTATPSLTLTPVSSTSSALFKKGSLVVKTGESFPDTFPGTVHYCLGPSAGCAPAVTTCPAGSTCLMRIVNGTPSAESVLARNISDVQFRYIIDGTTMEADTLTNPAAVRAVRIMLDGETVRTAGLSQGARAREVETVAYIRNR